MGVCLSKGGHGQHHGHMLMNDEDGFCTPEGVSSQYESPNPSGRYSFAHLETPRVSADVGDFGALGSLFYKRGSRSRDNHASTTGGNYISPLDMFLGGVTGRNRVHHVNQICTGDYSFASYLASPLLKGFDVHAMEAVAKSYAESAAKAAARDTFVFLEENDVSVSSMQGGGDSTSKISVSFGAVEDESFDAAPAAGDDCGDVDDDLAKSGESEEWEEPRKSESWDEDVNTTFNQPPNFRALNERGTNDRWVSVLNAVQARAKARRRQRRKSSLGKGHGTKERGGDGGRKKTVRFRLPGVQEGLTDDDIRSGKESEYEQALEEIEVLCDSGEAPSTITAQQSGLPADYGVKYLERSDTRQAVSSSDAAAAAEEECDYYLWQDDEEEERGGGSGEGEFFEEEIIDSEFGGFTASEVREGLRATASEVFDGLRGAPSSGGATPLVLAPAEHAHFHHPSVESYSSSEYLVPETSFGSSQQQEEDGVDSSGFPPGDEDDDDEATSFAHHHHGAVLDEDEAGEEENFFLGGGDETHEDNGRQFYLPAEYSTFGDSEVAAFPPVPSNDDRALALSFMKDISVSNETTAAAHPPAIPMGCVVVESRLADGSRLNPQVLDVSEVQLPKRGENNYGFFHSRALCSGESSPSGSDANSDHEGSFSFPVLSPSSPAIPSPESTSYSREARGGGGLWRDSPVADHETPIKNRVIRPHPAPAPSPLSPSSTTANPEREVHEIVSPRYAISDDNTNACDPRSSFSFDIEPTIIVPRKTHDIVLPTVPARSLASSPVFTPSNSAIPPLRSSTGSSPSLIPSGQVQSVPYPPKARRTFNRKLKFYSLERASYAAAGAKRSKSPPSFSRQSRERRRGDPEGGESDSDLFELETMSGTNAMGSSRTPPSTPTKSPIKIPAGAATFDFEKLSDSIARVSRSRSKRNGATNSSMKTAPLASTRNSKGRCLPVEKKRDSVFQEGGGVTGTKSMSQNSLTGRALLKLGLFMRTKQHCQQHLTTRSNHSRDSEPYKSSESIMSEYLENKPPSPTSRQQLPHGRRGQQCVVEEERPANHNYAFEWYCSSMGQRVAPLQHEKRPQQHSFSSHHRSFSNEDRTFAVKN